MSNLSDLYILINLTLYILTFLFYIYRRKKYDVCAYLLSIYAVSAIASVYYFFNYEYQRGYVTFTLVPFIYLYLMLMICFTPFYMYAKKVNVEHIRVKNSKFLILLSYFIAIISIEPFFENLLGAFRSSANVNELTRMYELNAANASENIYSWVGGKLNRINGLFSGIIPILLFYQFTLVRKNKFLISTLVLAFLNVPLGQYALGGRSGLIQQVLYILFIYFLLNKFIDRTIKKKIVKYGGGIIGLLLFLGIVISVVRFNSLIDGNQKFDLWTWLSLYAGEGYNNFCSMMWNLKITTEGDYCFSFFKDIIGLDTFENLHDRRNYWGPKMGIPPLIFYTFIGDFYGDLGLIGCTIFLSFITYLIVYITKKKMNIETGYPLENLILLCIWGKVCAIGFTFYCYNTYDALQTLSISLIIFLIIKFSKSNKKQIE